MRKFLYKYISFSLSSHFFSDLRSFLFCSFSSLLSLPLTLAPFTVHLLYFIFFLFLSHLLNPLLLLHSRPSHSLQWYNHGLVVDLYDLRPRSPPWICMFYNLRPRRGYVSFMTQPTNLCLYLSSQRRTQKSDLIALFNIYLSLLSASIPVITRINLIRTHYQLLLRNYKSFTILSPNNYLKLEEREKNNNHSN